ncbi:MAG: UDP-2,4-diacetamido-2,4,6-trideoxy-beta-L-altropyranose hydrolase [Lysinibacillus sp.]
MNTLNQATLYIRADASQTIGVGHIMRCLAIGESWKKAGGRVCFLVKDIPSLLREQLLQQQFQVLQIPSFTELQEEIDWLKVNTSQKSAILLLDGYHFTDSYQAALKHYFKLVVIDDYSHANHYYADLILNRNLIADEQLYLDKKQSYTKLLLGMQYNYIREEFKKYRREDNNVSANIKNVLINFGGGDSQNYTEATIRFLKHTPNIHLTVVVGPAYKGHEKLDETIKQVEGRVTVLQNVNNMAEIMSTVDVAIIAAGTTLFEAAYVGVPTIAIKTATNQRSVDVFANVYKGTYVIDAIKHFDAHQFQQAWTYIQSPQNRLNMIRNGQKLADNEGNQRVIHELAQLLIKE